MAPNPTVSDLLERHQHTLPSYTPMPLLSELADHGMAAPTVLIVTCADPRCVPEKIFQLGPLDAIVFRNPGGHTRHEIPGLLSLDHLLGGFQEVVVMHHTDCGTLKFKNEGVKEALKTRGVKGEDVEGMEFGAVENLEQSVKDDVAILKDSYLIRPELKEHIRGFVFDVQSGGLTEVPV